MSPRPEPSPEEIARFREQGFLVVEEFVDPELAARVGERFPALFRGEFETTVPPDEWRWVEGRDPEDVTRMIWNGWKADRTVAALALSEQVGRWCARLADWQGTRLNQDGCLWKPPGATGLAFHQDATYNQWVDPVELMTCWIPLDDVGPDSGTLEYARGSHTWGRGPKPSHFHRPSEHREALRAAAEEAGREIDLVTVSLPRGGAAFHHHWLYHGSGTNETSRHRRALALHCMPRRCRFHPENPAFAQGRYRLFGSTEMSESFYPVLFSEDGYRSDFLEEYLSGDAAFTRRDGRAYRSHSWSSES